MKRKNRRKNKKRFKVEIIIPGTKEQFKKAMEESLLLFVGSPQVY